MEDHWIRSLRIRCLAEAGWVRGKVQSLWILLTASIKFSKWQGVVVVVGGPFFAPKGGWPE